eukprot:2988684-Amphidinium_carterae.1
MAILAYSDLGASLAVRNFAKIGASLSMVGSSLSMRSFTRFGSSVSMCGRGCLGSSLSVLDYA